MLLVPGFNDFEIWCRCGNPNCKDTHTFIDEEIQHLLKLSYIRSQLKIKMIVQSGRRCPLNGDYSSTSSHSLMTKEGILYSVATDITPVGISLQDYYFECLKYGFSGIGYDGTGGSVHTDSSKFRRAIWGYDSSGKAMDAIVWEALNSTSTGTHSDG